ncbi:hypothetical protein DsansV1_C27g0198531 [Dioscorea sansibarensis]
MKSSLKKLTGFSLHKSDPKENKGRETLAKLDELVQASQDLQDIRNCYDTLLSAAAATANGAYEFSVYLKEMGDCLLNRTSLNDDEGNENALSMLGKAQYELQKLLDTYRGHITQTITNPSESLIKELQLVEEMKRQCDDKRDMYKFMLEKQREKGRTKHTKGETFSAQQLHEAQEEYENQVTLFVFRLKSLKQGQSRSLLTQAARHHAAQLNFFRKGLKFLEDVDSYIKVDAEQQHIDYQIQELDDNAEEDVDDSGGYDSNDGDDEPSFDYSRNDRRQEVFSMPRSSWEDRNQADLLGYSGMSKAGSQSAPIFAEKIFDSSDKFKETQPSTTRKSYSYVLPTPGDTKNSDFVIPKVVFSAQPKNNDGRPAYLWHSSPLEPNKSANEFRADGLPSNMRSARTVSVLKENNRNSDTRMPPPLAESSMLQYNARITSTKKNNRQAFSDPIISKPAESMSFAGSPTMVSARRSPTHQPSISPSISPRASSPKISELHELPRPPISSTRSPRPYSLVDHSAPLVSRGQEHQISTKLPSAPLETATPLPPPPTGMMRSHSIPSSGQRTPIASATKSLKAPHTTSRVYDFASPHLMPLPPSSKA